MTSDSSQVISRDLADRLAMNFWTYPLGIPMRSRIVPDALPQDMPVDIPIPTGSRVLGSVVTEYLDASIWWKGGMATSGQVVRVFLDAPGTPNTIFTAYQTVLEERGWTLAPNIEHTRLPRETPSFDSGPPPTSWRRGGTFCAGLDGPSLWVAVFELSPEMSDVRLFLVPADGTTCRPPQPIVQRDHTDDMRCMARVSPRFEAPVGARIVRSLGSGDDRRWTTTTTCESSLQVEELAAHFGDQIRAVGWSEQSRGVNGAIAWSTWSTAEAGEWEGTLLVVQDPQPNHRFLSWRMWAKGDEGVYPRRG